MQHQQLTEIIERLTKLERVVSSNAETECGQREWVGLTDEEIEEALPGLRWIDAVDTYHAIEAKLKEKNK